MFRPVLIELPPFEDRRTAYLSANPPPGPPPARDMVWVPGGAFRMGSEQFYPEERPVRDVSVGGFWMDSTPVTNAAFARFVEATGHITSAERDVDASLYPGASPAELQPAGLVFRRAPGPIPLDNARQWWRITPGAHWRNPRGDGRHLPAERRHPVVQVSHEDAAAYARWAGKSLPTEAEWEFAARGGLDGAVFVWGNSETGDAGKRLANTWQGRFPFENTTEDGFEHTSPVGSFPANGYGLYDMAGNVWEWTDDLYLRTAPQQSVCCGGPAESAANRLMVLKGGSHLCAPNYCFRYRPAARSSQAADTSTNHIGFRCIIRA